MFNREKIRNSLDFNLYTIREFVNEEIVPMYPCAEGFCIEVGVDQEDLKKEDRKYEFNIKYEYGSRKCFYIVTQEQLKKPANLWESLCGFLIKQINMPLFGVKMQVPNKKQLMVQSYYKIDDFDFDGDQLYIGPKNPPEETPEIRVHDDKMDSAVFTAFHMHHNDIRSEIEFLEDHINFLIYSMRDNEQEKKVANAAYDARYRVLCDELGKFEKRKAAVKEKCVQDGITTEAALKDVLRGVK